MCGVLCDSDFFEKRVHGRPHVTTSNFRDFTHIPTYNIGEAELLIYKPEVVCVFHCFMIGSLRLTWNY